MRQGLHRGLVRRTPRPCCTAVRGSLVPIGGARCWTAMAGRRHPRSSTPPNGAAPWLPVLAQRLLPRRVLRKAQI